MVFYLFFRKRRVLRVHIFAFLQERSFNERYSTFCLSFRAGTTARIRIPSERIQQSPTITIATKRSTSSDINFNWVVLSGQLFEISVQVFVERIFKGREREREGETSNTNYQVCAERIINYFPGKIPQARKTWRWNKRESALERFHPHGFSRIM